MDAKTAQGVEHAYVWNKAGLNKVDTKKTEYLMGKLQILPKYMLAKYVLWKRCLSLEKWGGGSTTRSTYTLKYSCWQLPVDDLIIVCMSGLFEPSHQPYESERDHQTDPSLAEMTTKAIEVLQNNNKGFFLMVEGTVTSPHSYCSTQTTLMVKGCY